MNSLLPCSINKEKSKKLIVRTMLLLCLIPIVINATMLVWLYTSISSNAAFEQSSIDVVIKYLQDFLDLTAFAVSYALIIFSALLISRKRMRLAILLYTLFFALRIPIGLAMNVVIYGTLGNYIQITVDLIYLFAYFALTMLQLLIVCIFAVTDSNKYLYHIEMQKAKSKSKDKKGRKNQKDKKEEAPKHFVLPFSKFINWYNPLQRSAIKMGIMIVIMRLFSRILNDVLYGAPQSWGEAMIMVLYYASDILYGVVAYIIALIVFNVAFDKLKATKEKTDEEKSPSVLDS